MVRHLVPRASALGVALVAFACSTDRFSLDDAGGDAATAPDTSVADAARPDGGADASLDASVGCAAPHFFCDDFDDLDAGAFSRWSSVSPSLGTLRLSDAGLSAPNAASFLTPAHDASFVGPGLAVTLAAAKGLHCEFDVRGDIVSPSAPVMLVHLTASLPPGAPIASWESYLRHDPGSQFNLFDSIRLSDGGFPQNNNAIIAGSLTLGQWTHVVIELSAGVMNLKVGNGRATAMSDFPADNTALRFEIVTLLYVPPSESAFLFDNVVCDRL